MRLTAPPEIAVKSIGCCDPARYTRTPAPHAAYNEPACRFADHGDFSEKLEYFVRPTGAENFAKPVIVFTDNATVNAAEVAPLHFKALTHVTQIGTATSGDFSDTSMRRFLPNGFQYQYSIMQFLLPDGRSLGGVGHVPDIEVRNRVADIEAGRDVVLERAYSYLREEFGIR